MYVQITAQGCGLLRCGNKVPAGAWLSLTVVGLVGTSEERKADCSKLGEAPCKGTLEELPVFGEKEFSCGRYGQKRWRRRRLAPKVGPNLLGLLISHSPYLVHEEIYCLRNSDFNSNMLV